ncbi:MAG: hypothetical protein ABI972_12525 [Acidobacteriota bacterium]
MDEARALHTAARRYCRTQHDEWWQKDQTLGLRLFHQGTGRWKTDQATPEEFAVYPRWMILQAILREVEMLDPDDLPPMSDLRSCLRKIGREATDDSLAYPGNEPGTPAMDDERRRFLQYIESLSQLELGKVRPLPYLRILTVDETKPLWDLVEKRWGIKGYCYPPPDGELPSDMLAFHTDYFDEQKIEIVRKILAERGIKRIRQLRGIGLEIELESFQVSFSVSMGSKVLYGAGEEGYWMSEGQDFLVCASHEASITIGGAWLVEAFEHAVPGCRERTYLGELRSDDFRGRWF